jgi:hypothetical protein
MGTKAWAKAPSANNRLNKFGIRKATNSASVEPEAPNLAAITISLANPKKREIKVKKLTTDKDLNKPIYLDYESIRGAGYESIRGAGYESIRGAPISPPKKLISFSDRNRLKFK